MYISMHIDIDIDMISVTTLTRMYDVLRNREIARNQECEVGVTIIAHATTTANSQDIARIASRWHASRVLRQSGRG